jgi:hypothetical protein
VIETTAIDTFSGRAVNCTVSSNPASLTSIASTTAPSATRRTTIALPIPDPAPVTMTILF